MPESSTVEFISMCANVAMAGAALLGVGGLIWWKRQPSWQHARDVAAEVYEDFLAVEHSIGQGIAAMREASSALVGLSRSDSPGAFAKVGEMLVGHLEDMQKTADAFGDALPKVSATWGVEIGGLFLLSGRLASGFRQAYQTEIESLVGVTPDAATGIDFADGLPWSDYIHERSDGAKKIDDLKETVGGAIVEWAKASGAVAEPTWWRRRKLRQAAERFAKQSRALAPGATR